MDFKSAPAYTGFNELQQQNQSKVKPKINDSIHQFCQSINEWDLFYYANFDFIYNL
jgi:hypothetical protein